MTLRFGITLANRGVLLGMCTPRDLLRMADAAEACPRIDSVWAGDALFANRRLDALTLLAAVAGRTERVLLGPACMASFALREPRAFAYEWASAWMCCRADGRGWRCAPAAAATPRGRRKAARSGRIRRTGAGA